MNIPDDLLCLFTAEVSKENGSYRIEVPSREISQGEIQSEEVYRVAVIPPATETTEQQEAKNSQGAPVTEGEIREVEIEDTGDQGDGLARIDGGYVVIVPDTDIGDRVKVRVDEVRETVAFADVVDEERA